MHRPAAIALIALFATTGVAVAQSEPGKTDPTVQPAPPPAAEPTPGAGEAAKPQSPPSMRPQTPPQITEQVPPVSPPPVAPSAGQPGAPPPDGQRLASPEHQKQADEALKTPSGQAGKQEPGASADAAPAAPVSVGLHGVPGMPEDGQTTPAKYSKRNAALDRLPLVTIRLGLDDAQRKAVLDSIGQAGAKTAKIEAAVAQELPEAVALHEFPEALRRELPILSGLSYVRLPDRVLVVRAPNRVVVAEIKG